MTPTNFSRCPLVEVFMTDNAAIVERMYADFAKGDIAAVLALLDEQVRM